MSNKATRPVKNESFWRSEFEAFAASRRASEEKLFKEPDPFGHRRIYELFPGSTFDLSVNPIVAIRSAYPANDYFREYSQGAEVTLKDGTIFRWDAMHGGGGWKVKESGRIQELPFRWRVAVDSIRSSNRNAEQCLEIAKSENQNQCFQHWSESDRHMQRGALYALIFFLWWIQEA